MKRVFEDVSELLSHQVKTPLTRAKGYLALLEQERWGTLSREQKTKISKIRKEMDRVIMLVEELCILAETAWMRRRFRINLARTLAEILSLLQEDAREKMIRLQLSSAPFYVLANKRLLREAFINIAENAIKYTKKGGRIHVYTRRRRENVYVYIKDEGIGLRREQLPRIFEKYYKGEESGGMGLGLSIAKRIIEKHGGRVWAKSQEGGATFIVALPTA
jgi:two-component system phosphate regulon sensor histidine kinase PhoR